MKASRISLFTLAAALSVALGCATGQPASKAQTFKAYDNTVNINVTLHATDPRGPECQELPVTIVITDIFGSLAADASAGANDSTTQTAAPQLAAGLTGDKPIETAGETAKTAMTGGGSSAADAGAALAKKGVEYVREKVSTNSTAEASSAAPAADAKASETAKESETAKPAEPQKPAEPTKPSAPTNCEGQACEEGAKK